MYVYINIYMYIFICIYICVCVCVCVRVCVFVSVSMYKCNMTTLSDLLEQPACVYLKNYNMCTA